MSTLTKLALSATLLASSMPTLAQDTKKVPVHHDYILSCMEAISPTTELDVATGFAICQCHHESLPKDGDMTESEFTQGLNACHNEAKREPKVFTRKYLDRFKRAGKNAD